MKSLKEIGEIKVFDRGSLAFIGFIIVVMLLVFVIFQMFEYRNRLEAVYILENDLINSNCELDLFCYKACGEVNYDRVEDRTTKVCIGPDCRPLLIFDLNTT